MDIVQEAYNLAKETREKAYAKFSGFQVGAAIKVKGHDKLFTGCNVENSTYGLTICAERTGIVKMISELGGSPEIEFVVVIADTEEATPPCGLCLQSINEFASDDTKLYLSNLNGIIKELAFKEAFPMGFKFEPGN